MLKVQARLDRVTAAELDLRPLTQDSGSQQLPNQALRRPWLHVQALTLLQTEALHLHHSHDLVQQRLHCLAMPAGCSLQYLGMMKLVWIVLEQRLIFRCCRSQQSPQLTDSHSADMVRLTDSEHLSAHSQAHNEGEYDKSQRQQSLADTQ